MSEWNAVFADAVWLFLCHFHHVTKANGNAGKDINFTNATNFANASLYDIKLAVVANVWASLQTSGPHRYLYIVFSEHSLNLDF